MKRDANNLLGFSQIVCGNCLLLVVLEALQKESDNADVRATSLLLINAFLGLLLFRRPLRAAVFQRSRSVAAVVVWSIGYCVGYGIFLVFPNHVSTVVVMVAKCFSPTLAIPFLKKANAATSTTVKMLGLTALVMLCGLAIPRNTSNIQVSVVYSTLVVLAFLFSQIGIRIASSSDSHAGSSGLLSAFNAILLFVVLGFSDKLQTISIAQLALTSMLAPIVLLLQLSHLRGVKNSSPIVGAVALSTSIPLSSVADAIFGVRALDHITMFLGLIYCAIVALMVYTADRSETTGFFPSK